jgi:hypothetical protein
MKDLTDNEVLAEFDGYKLRWASDTSVNNNGPSSWPLYTKDGITTDAVHYDSDWRELMPVWYKFRAFKVGIEDGLLAVEIHTRSIEDAILIGPTPAEACKLLANAIRWYQSVKK